jgi:hypothetical protein
MNHQNSVNYFHLLPANLNCAQAILRGFQQEFGISNQEIDDYRAFGGGRAPEGVCGALFAANRLLRQIGKESVVEEFSKNAGGLLCADIRDKHFTCAEYVRMADELVQKKL